MTTISLDPNPKTWRIVIQMPAADVEALGTDSMGSLWPNLMLSDCVERGVPVEIEAT